jgi:hypothetical protein
VETACLILTSVDYVSENVEWAIRFDPLASNKTIILSMASSKQGNQQQIPESNYNITISNDFFQSYSTLLEHTKQFYDSPTALSAVQVIRQLITVDTHCISILMDKAIFTILW